MSDVRPTLNEKPESHLRLQKEEVRSNIMYLVKFNENKTEHKNTQCECCLTTKV